MDEVKVRKVGNSLGVTLTEQCRQMGVSEGDTLYVVKTEQGIELRKERASFDEALAIAEDFMDRYSDAMRKLAE